MYVVSSKQMKKAEQTYVDSGACEFLPLMERAGTAASKVILQRENPAKAVILCGSGNNGGDGFVIARHLSDRISWKAAFPCRSICKIVQGTEKTRLCSGFAKWCQCGHGGSRRRMLLLRGFHHICCEKTRTFTLSGSRMLWRSHCDGYWNRSTDIFFSWDSEQNGHEEDGCLCNS